VMFFIDKDNFDRVLGPTPDQMQAAIPKLAAQMLERIQDGGEAAFENLRQEYGVYCSELAPNGTRARLKTNMIWNIAEEQVRKSKIVVCCLSCKQKNRMLVISTNARCGKCGMLLDIADMVL